MRAPPLANAGTASAQGSAEHADEAGPAETALRGHFGHVGDLAEVAFEGGCNNNCDRLGAAGAGQRPTKTLNGHTNGNAMPG